MNSGIGFLLRVTDSVTRVALALSDGDDGYLMEWFEFMGYDQAVGWSPTNIPYPLVVPGNGSVFQNIRFRGGEASSQWTPTTEPIQLEVAVFTELDSPEATATRDLRLLSRCQK